MEDKTLFREKAVLRPQGETVSGEATEVGVGEMHSWIRTRGNGEITLVPSRTRASQQRRLCPYAGAMSGVTAFVTGKHGQCPENRD